MKDCATNQATSSCTITAHVWIGWTWSSMSWVRTPKDSRHTMNICSLDFSACTFDLRSFKYLSSIYHFFHQWVNLVTCLLEDIATNSWFEWALEANLNLIFRQSVVADGAIIILFSIGKKVGSLKLLDNTWESNHTISKLLDVLHELRVVLSNLFVEAQVLILIIFIDLFFEKNSDRL